MKINAFSSLLLISLCGALSAAEIPVPKLSAGLEMRLFAAEPEIVTPTGVTVDAKGRVFVIENNTHQVQGGYKGHPTDRVKVFTDNDGDGKADGHTVFADGFKHAMNLMFLPDGALVLVHRNGVVRLEDKDGDGTAEVRKDLLILDTKVDYPHNGLSGIVLNETDGWLYVGSGENFGEIMKFRAADGSALTWNPGGAVVLRMKPDGSQLQLHAWGMWNNFNLECDGAGRLFSLDNDPDSRPPCRLLHVVPGGDYGFQFQYGRAGLHPYQSWDGEAYGTLPMTAGTGEAPTGMLDARRFRLGAGRGQGLLVTGWGDSTLEWYTLKPRGASVTAQKEVIATGDTNFRPACLAAAPDGSVFVTDWADRAYPVHGKGRIWQLRAVEPDKTGAREPLPLSDAEKRMKSLAEGKLTGAVDASALLADRDPFVNAAGIHYLATAASDEVRATCAKHADGAVRAGALAAQRRRAPADAAAHISRGLTDADWRVRLLALQWAGEGNAGPNLTERKAFRELQPQVEKALQGIAVTPELFLTWLATVDLLERTEVISNNNAPKTFQPKILAVLKQPDASDGLRISALRALRDLNAEAAPVLMDLAKNGSPAVRAEAVRSLAFVPGAEAAALLRSLALDDTAPEPLRLDALAGLGTSLTDADLEALLPLLQVQSTALRRTALRTLWPHAGHEPVQAAIKKAIAALDTLDEAFALAAGAADFTKRPKSVEEWTAAIAGGKADPDNGRRVFFSRISLCATCHAAEGRGGNVGPDLSTIARSSDRARLLQSILQPGASIAPLYAVKTVVTKKGETFSGIPAAVDSSQGYHLLQPDGSLKKIARPDVAEVSETPASLMPQGLENTMAVQDLRDLLAWMETLR